MSNPDFWLNSEAARDTSLRLNALKNTLDSFRYISSKFDDTSTLLQLAIDDNDDSFEKDIDADIADIYSSLENLRLCLLLNQPFDKNNAFLTLHAGAGGTEAQDWNQMLLRMYLRWAARHNFVVETTDLLSGDEAGVKSVSLFIKGLYAYGLLKSEKGIHRLVRISPFDSNSRRHTSFAACDVMPEIDDSIHVDINMSDVRVDTFRASGAGGQHINKTSSAVRMTHIPTGIVVQCQNERSQLQNREQCLKMLRSKLFQLEIDKKNAQIAKLEGDRLKIEWGSQIRSYVFQPYTLVKDLRTGYETSNVQAVMDGDIDPFIRSFLSEVPK